MSSFKINGVTKVMRLKFLEVYLIWENMFFFPFPYVSIWIVPDTIFLLGLKPNSINNENYISCLPLLGLVL